MTSSVTPTPSSTPPCECNGVNNITPGNPNGSSTIRVFYTDCNGSPTTLNIVQGDSGCVCGTITAVEWADASIPPPGIADYTITYGSCP